jgi:acetoin utilization deacetylase AcuC-like enzyme
VFTVSFHHKAPDFYPTGTGRPQEVGEGSGLYHNLNIPLKAGCTDAAFTSLFEEVCVHLCLLLLLLSPSLMLSLSLF